MSKKVLIVDDRIETILFLPDILESYGYSATLVDDGYKAIKLVGHSFYDIVICDINMPGINGVETFKRIKKISPTSEVIMMTAAADSNLVNEAKDEGTFAVIQKPFNMDMLIDTLTKAANLTRILIASSDKKEKKAIKKILSKRKYKSVTVTGGENAMEVLNNGEVHLVLIGSDLDDMNGVELIKKIREKNFKVKIMLLDEEDNIKNTKNILEEESCAYFCKPLDIDKIFNAVEKIRQDHIGPGNLLLVEDDLSLSKSISGILKKEGYKVTCVAEGEEALKKCRRNIYNIAIIDYKLPDMDGISLVRKIKKHNSNIKVIFMSGYATLDMAIDAIKEDVMDFFEKPIDPEKLLKSIKKIKAKINR